MNDITKWSNWISKRLANFGLIFMGYFCIGSAYLFYTNHFDLHTNIVIRFWPDSNYAISIFIATALYISLWKLDKINTIAWFLFYDITFQGTLSLIAPLDSTDIVILFIVIILFYFNETKLNDMYLMICIWIVITLTTKITSSEFGYQIIWSTSIVAIQYWKKLTTRI